MQLDKIEGEVWREVRGYEALYMVSNFGRIKALPKTVIAGWNKVTINYQENLMFISKTKRNYYRVKLSKGGKSKTIFVHRLVAIAFIPNDENKTDVNHKDGNPSNNRLENLEWATHTENIRHAVSIGLMKNTKRGIDVFGSVLNDSKVKEIREIGKLKPQRDIAKIYGVNQATILRILQNKTWRHVS